MCSIATHMGWTFNGYAALLDLDDGVLATPDVGGAALASKLRVVDLAGLADARLARPLSQGNVPQYNEAVFARNPDFIELHFPWGMSLFGDPRLTEGYVEIRRTAETDGVWVRADLVTKQQLAKLKAWDLAVAQPAERRHLEDAPRGSCGDRIVAHSDPLTIR
jgi:hypothetical protein